VAQERDYIERVWGGRGTGTFSLLRVLAIAAEPDPGAYAEILRSVSACRYSFLSACLMRTVEAVTTSGAGRSGSFHLGFEVRQPFVATRVKSH
jgi:hypothetical protein